MATRATAKRPVARVSKADTRPRQRKDFRPIPGGNTLAMSIAIDVAENLGQHEDAVRLRMKETHRLLAEQDLARHGIDRDGAPMAPATQGAELPVLEHRRGWGFLAYLNALRTSASEDEIASSSHASKGTVHDAMPELETLGWVEDCNPRWRIKPAGIVAADQYRQYHLSTV